MNKMENDFGAEGAAVLEYLDGEYRVVKPGAYVECAVTGIRIPLDALRYWNAELQEPYATADVALKRFREMGKTPR
jgi:hypothetical protein